MSGPTGGQGEEPGAGDQPGRRAARLAPGLIIGTSLLALTTSQCGRAPQRPAKPNQPPPRPRVRHAPPLPRAGFARQSEPNQRPGAPPPEVAAPAPLVTSVSPELPAPGASMPPEVAAPAPSANPNADRAGEPAGDVAPPAPPQTPPPTLEPPTARPVALPPPLAAPLRAAPVAIDLPPLPLLADRDTAQPVAPAPPLPPPTPAPAPRGAAPASQPPLASPAVPAALAPAALPKPAFGKSADRQPADLEPQRAPASPMAAAAGVCAASAGPGATAHVLNGPAPRFTADDELILELRSQHGEMTDTITGLDARSGTYLPLGAIARFLDLPIPVSDSGHYASGWFLAPERKLSLSLREGKLIVAGRELPLGTADAVAYEGELYVRAERFADLLPLVLAVDPRAAQVTVKTCEPFPFEQKLAREAARERLVGNGAHAQRNWPRQATPYRALTIPIGEAETRAISSSTIGSRVEQDIRLAGDVAFMTGRLFVATASNFGVTAARLELGRRDPDAQLLGPLKASEFELGDIGTASMPLGLRGAGGRGVFVTNLPLGAASVFDTIDLRGELPDGYEVELYRNNALIASTATPVDGQYQFLGVAVDFGVNEFRLVFYGPQGQRREEVRRITVGDGRLAKGTFTYTVGAVQKDLDLFAIKGPQFTPAQDYGAWRGTALAQYGLATAATAELGAAWFQLGGRAHWQSLTGLRTGFGPVAIKLDLGLQDGGGRAIEVGLGGRLLGATYVLTHTEYGGGFIDEVREPSDQPLARATTADLNATLHFGGLFAPVAAHFDQLAFPNGTTQSDASLRASVTVAGFVGSNTVDYTSSSSPGQPASHTLVGSFDLASFSGGRTQYRANLGYQLMGGARLTSAGVEIDRTIDPRTLVKAQLNYALTSHQAQLGLSAQRHFDRFTLSLDSSYATPQRNYSLLLRLGFSFGRNPLTGRMFMALPGLSGSGAVAVRAFRDENGDGRYDAGDTPLPAVNFATSVQHATTDAAGVALLGGIGDGARVNVAMDTASLPDVDMAPASEGIAVVPRAGRIHVAEFPVAVLSSVEGTVYFADSDAGANAAAKGREVSGVILWVVDLAGKPIARARTEADGYFLFEQLHPGDYRLELDRAQAANLKIHLAQPLPLHFSMKSANPRVSVRVVSDVAAGASAAPAR